LTALEAISRSPRNYPKTEVGQHRLVLKKGVIMFVFILNAIYRQFLKASLSA